MIRRMQKCDIERVVAVHLSSFPGFFLSFLGPRFLALYYAGICSSPEGIGFVSLNPAGDPAGFVVGTSNPRGFYKTLLKRDGMKFFLASLGFICRKPLIAKRVARALSYPSKIPTGEELAGLFSIGVMPEMQGNGTGKKLVLEFIKEARRKGCKKVFLTTDRDHNDNVNAFYQKMGFKIERQYDTPEGRRMNEYWMEIS